MMVPLDRKRILIFLSIAFGIAWATALVIALTGGMVNSPTLAPGLTLAVILLACVYMMAPALAHIFTRILTREGWQANGLRLNFRHGWKFWLAAWVLPALFTVLGAAVYFLLFPATFDHDLAAIRIMLAGSGPAWSAVAPALMILFVILQGVLISPIVNGVFTFGEEFGWRAYLLPKLMPLGGRRAVLVSGVIWGVWHAPIIAMGHNYGLVYPGYPWLGMLAMVLFCVAAGAFLSWVTLRAGSVWPAVIGHAAINGISGLSALVLIGQPNPLLGPLPTGVVGMLGWLITAALIFMSTRALAPGASTGIAGDGVAVPTAVN